MKNIATPILLSLVFAAGLSFSSRAPAQDMPGMEMPAPKATPKPAPKATPKPAPKATPKPAPKATPKPAPTATPKPAPGPSPEMPGMVMPQPMPAPQATPRTTPAPSLEMPGTEMSPPLPAVGVKGGMTALPNLSDRKDWPSPTADDMKRSYLLFDRLEYGAGNLHWDVLGWHGGDYRRTWFKSEADQSTRGKGVEGDVQLLRGKLISPYFDFQYGLRFEAQHANGSTRGRAFAVIGLQGLAPYRFDIEPALFVDQSGNISGRFTGTYDVLLSQSLILQPRLETNLALQQVERFGVGRGLNDVELGLLLRYEIRREFAPYIGVTYNRSFGGSASFLRREGEDPSSLRIVGGVRMWF